MLTQKGFWAKAAVLHHLYKETVVALLQIWLLPTAEGKGKQEKKKPTFFFVMSRMQKSRRICLPDFVPHLRGW